MQRISDEEAKATYAGALCLLYWKGAGWVCLLR